MRMIALSLILLALTVTTAMAGVSDRCFEEMPFGCLLIRSDIIPKDQTDSIGRKLGAPLRRLSNNYLRIQGKPVQVNILEAATPTDAVRIHKTISAMKGHPAFCLIQDNKVIEFCNADVATAIKTSYELGFSPKPRKILYGLTAQISTINKADYLSFNELFNVFLNTNTKNPSQESINKIKTLSRDFIFGTSISLRKQPNRSTSYEFTPSAVEITDMPPDQTSYSFKQIPNVLGIPFVTLSARITCDDTGMTPTDRKADKGLLSATSYWPVDDPQIQALAKKITSEKSTSEAKALAILEWLTPGKNIKSAGPTGSRWGVKKVLKQMYGNCWDSSDCFITLARAAGVPSRQIGGWLYGTGGHIWAEVLIEGKGWQQVDPTGGGKLSCGIYHIPYFTTESGEMPILYLSMPQIAILETE